jgi:hypothetical protein
MIAEGSRGRVAECRMIEALANHIKKQVSYGTNRISNTGPVVADFVVKVRLDR